MSVMSEFKSSTFGCSTCMRQKASNWPVSDAARSTALSLTGKRCGGWVLPVPDDR